jgi:hypothetical protein
VIGHSYTNQEPTVAREYAEMLYRESNANVTTVDVVVATSQHHERYPRSIPASQPLHN